MGRGNDRDERSAASLYDQAWQLQQRWARDEYLGDPVDVDQLRRDIGALALVVAELAEKIEAKP